MGEEGGSEEGSKRERGRKKENLIIISRSWIQFHIVFEFSSTAVGGGEERGGLIIT